MYYNEQSAKPNYEQKVQSTNDTQQKSTDPNKDYAPQDNNKVNPSQTPDNSFIYDTQISYLVESGTQFDTQTVQITGEVIGDLIVVSDYPD